VIARRRQGGAARDGGGDGQRDFTALHPSALLHAQPARGRSLTIALPNTPLTIDPINQLNHDAMALGQTVFENLVEYDIDGVLKRHLARELPEISEDKLTYTLRLRDDVRFQNGRRLTAADVKYSFDYLLNPGNRTARRSLFNRIAETTAVPDDTVRIRTRSAPSCRRSIAASRRARPWRASPVSAAWQAAIWARRPPITSKGWRVLAAIR
jgi:ABC-type transport system substrate-binding protein